MDRATHFLMVHACMVKTPGKDDWRRHYWDSGVREIMYLDGYSRILPDEDIAVFKITFKEGLVNTQSKGERRFS